MSQTPKFEEVVVEAERLLRRDGAVDYSDPETGFDLYVKAQAMMHREKPDAIFELARGNKLAHAVSVELGAEVLPAPKTRGPMPGRFALRDRQIIMAVFRLSESMKVSPTRNDEGEKLSACDAVADAWLRLYRTKVVNKPISYEYVKELWKQRPGKGQK